MNFPSSLVKETLSLRLRSCVQSRELAHATKLAGMRQPKKILCCRCEQMAKPLFLAMIFRDVELQVFAEEA